MKSSEKKNYGSTNLGKSTSMKTKTCHNCGKTFECDHKRKNCFKCFSIPLKNITKEECLEKVLLCKSLKEFRTKYTAYYRKSVHENWLHEITQHLKRRQSRTKEDCRAIALKYTSLVEIQKQEPAVHSYIYKKGWADEIYSHMSKQHSYTFEECWEAAQKCKTRTEFHRRFPKQYRKTCNARWADPIMNHMENNWGKNTRCFTKTNFIKSCQRNYGYGILYLLRCYDDDGSFYKIGITSGLLSERYRYHQMPYDYEVLWELNGDPATIWKLEKHYLNKIKNYKYIPDVTFQGHTECFSCHGNNSLLNADNVFD